MHHFAASLAPPVGPVGDARAAGIKPGPISRSGHLQAARMRRRVTPHLVGVTQPVAVPHGGRSFLQRGAKAAHAVSAPTSAPTINPSGRAQSCTAGCCTS